MKVISLKDTVACYPNVNYLCVTEVNSAIWVYVTSNQLRHIWSYSENLIYYVKNVLWRKLGHREHHEIMHVCDL